MPSAEEKTPGRLFVPSLTLTMYAERSLNLLLSLFLLDISITFGVTVGVASQIGMISAVATMLVGLIVGVLSVKFSHRLLLLAGAFIITIGVVGVFFAPSFALMQVFYPLDGVGSAMVGAMSFALIGRFLPLEKRSKAIGWTVAAASLAFVIGGPLLTFIAGAAGWRYVMLWFFLPVSIAGLVLAYFGIPSTSIKESRVIGKEAYLSSLKQVVLNKSAFACLAGTALFWASQGVWGLYVITFYRTRFSVSIEYAGIILLFMTLAVALGSIVGGRLVSRFGRKRLFVVTFSIASVLIAIFPFMPYLWIVLLLDLGNTWLRGMGLAAIVSLNLEQVPKSRGTMMSMAYVFAAFGTAIGIAVGGPVFDGFGFPVLVPLLGALGVASASLIYFFAKDPTKVVTDTQPLLQL